jgi:riboflavin transporter FmnP
MKLRALVTAALLIAVGVVLNFLIRLPLLPAAPFLEYSPADVPVLLGTFALGPLLGGLIGLLRALIAISFGTGGLVGAVMDASTIVVLAVVAGFIYSRMRTRKGAVLALVGGSFAMLVTALALNYFWALPVYLGVPQEQIATLIWTAILPFNLLKVSINAVIVFLLYKPLSVILHGRRESEKEEILEDA